MHRRLGSILVGLTLYGLTPCLAVAAGADGYPSGPVRFVVPYTAGGGTDILARIIAQYLSERVGQPVVVDNRGGGSGIVGAVIVAQAVPNGRTILMVTSGHAINANRTELPYDTLGDFAAVTLVARVANILVVHPSSPATSVKELIALAKSKPGQLSYASAGVGNPTHLGMELFNSMAGVEMVHVPYKGGAAALIDLVANRVQVFMSSIPTLLPPVRDKRLKGLAVTTRDRSSMAPEFPTVAETGLPGFESYDWYGILVPAGVPRDIVAQLSAAIVDVAKTPAVSKLITERGFELVASAPAEFNAVIRADLAKWGKVVRDAGIKLE